MPSLIFSMLFLFCLLSCAHTVAPSDGADAVGDNDAFDEPAAFARRPSLLLFSQELATRQFPAGAFVDGAEYGDEPSGNPFGLTVSSAGPCYTTRSTGSAPRSMGVLTVAWGARSSNVPPSTLGDYHASVGGFEWPAGTLISVSSSGDTVPAFSTSLSMPPSVTVTQPTNTTDQRLSFHAADGLQVRWFPFTAAGTRVEVEIGAIEDGPTYANIYCSFDSEAGTGSVPSGVLSIMTHASSPTLSIASRVQTTLRLGSYDLAVAVDAVAFYQAIIVQP